jgi:serine/threonine protein phosphatase PrpC
LGDLEFKQNKKMNQADQMITSLPDVTIENLQDVSFVVIGCDGVWDCMTNQEICDFINERLKAKLSLTKIVEEIFDYCLAEDIYNGKIN